MDILNIPRIKYQVMDDYHKSK